MRVGSLPAEMQTLSVSTIKSLADLKREFLTRFFKDEIDVYVPSLLGTKQKASDY